MVSFASTVAEFERLCGKNVTSRITYNRKLFTLAQNILKNVNFISGLATIMFALFKLEHMLLYLKLQFDIKNGCPIQTKCFATLSLIARHLSRITNEAFNYVLARRLNKSSCGMRIDSFWKNPTSTFISLISLQWWKTRLWVLAKTKQIITRASAWRWPVWARCSLWYKNQTWLLFTCLQSAPNCLHWRKKAWRLTGF